MADEWNPFIDQQSAEAVPMSLQDQPTSPQQAGPATPQQMPAAQEEWNPFMEGQPDASSMAAPTAPATPPPAAALPPEAQPQMQRSVVPPPVATNDRPFVQKIGEGFDPAQAEHVANAQKILMSSIAQGGVEALMNINQLAADIGTKIGLVKKETAQEMRANYDAEREQYKNIPYIKEHNIISGLIKDTSKFGLETAGPGAIAKAAGLGGTMVKNIAGDVLAGAVSGGLEDPGNVKSPFAQRGLEALGSGVVTGALSAPFRLLGGMRGVYTPERAAEQASNAQALKAAGTSGSVGQIIGNSNGLMGDRLQSVEAQAAKKVPLLGNDDKYYAQQEGIQKLQKEFVKSIEPKAADITTLTKQEITAAQMAGKSIADAALDKAYNLISDKTSAGSVKVDGIIDASNNIMKRFGNEISASPSANIVTKIIGDLQSKANGDLSFQQLWNLRKQLDDAAFNEYGIKAPSALVKKGTKELRDAIGTALDEHATAAGVGKEWKNVSRQYMENLGYKKLQDEITLSTSPLGRGGLSPGKGMLTFARNLDKKKAALGRYLNPDQKAAMLGVIKVTKLAAKNLRTVTPGLDVLSAAAGLGGLAAVTHMAGGPAAFTVGATIYGLTNLLHSAAGRELLTYAGKQPLQSLKLQQLAARLFQGLTSHIAQGMAQPLADNAGKH